jgi:hypothetical protein
MESIYKPSTLLHSSHITHVNEYDILSVYGELKVGTRVELRCEPDNPHDPESVAVYYNDAKLGYVMSPLIPRVFRYLYFGYGNIYDVYVSGMETEQGPEIDLKIDIRIKEKNGHGY